MRRGPAPRAAAALLALLAAADVGARGQEALPPVPEVDVSSLPDTIRREVEEARARVSEAPRDAAAAGDLGALYYVYDFPLAAAACFGRAAAIDPENIRWRYFLGVAQERVGDADEAIAALEKAVAIDGDDAPSLVRLAGLLLERDAARAGALYRHAVDLDPANAPAWFGLGEHARIAGRPDEALRHYGKALAVAPGYARANYAVAMILAARGRKDEAQDHLKRSSAGEDAAIPGDPLRIAILGKGRGSAMLRREAVRLAERGAIDEAIRVLHQAIETDVSGTTARHHLGLLLAQQGRFEEAIEHLRLVVRADPGNVEAKSTLGLALTEVGRTEEAQSLYRDVLERHPDHAPTLMYFGRVLAAGGRTEEALDFMRRAVRAQPANGLFRYTLGELLARAGRETEAIEHLGRAVEVMPSHMASRYTLGVLLARSGDIAGAKEQWLQVVAAEPSLAAPYRGLVGVALAGGDPEEAIRWAEALCGITGRRDGADLEMLARAYEAAGRGEEAARVRDESRRLEAPGVEAP